MSSIKHSKYKNTGVLFELLARQITEDTLNEKDSLSIKMVKNYFKKGTPLHKEYLLYKILMENKFSDEKKSEKLLDEIIKQRKRLNNNSLRKQKYNLIKEIRENYNDTFFDAKITNYKLLASIYKLFESELLTENVYNPLDVLSAKETILEHLNNKTEKKEEKQQVKENIDLYIGNDTELLLLSYKILVEKFNEKYGVSLVPEQKKLLRKYIYSVSNNKSLMDYVRKEIPIIQEKVNLLSKNIDKKEKVIHIKVNELSKNVANILKENKITENHLVVLMKYYELIKELKNLEKKNEKK